MKSVSLRWAFFSYKRGIKIILIRWDVSPHISSAWKDIQTFSCSVRNCICRKINKVAFKNTANFPGEHLCRSLFLTKVQMKPYRSLFNKEIPLPVFSCEFCEFFKNSCFVERLLFNNSHEKKYTLFSILWSIPWRVLIFLNVSDNDSSWLHLTR